MCPNRLCGSPLTPQVMPDITKDKLAFSLPDLDSAESQLELKVWNEWFASVVRSILRGDDGDNAPKRVKQQRAATAWFLRALSHALQQVVGYGLEAFQVPARAGACTLVVEMGLRSSPPASPSHATRPVSVTGRSMPSSGSWGSQPRWSATPPTE